MSKSGNLKNSSSGLRDLLGAFIRTRKYQIGFLIFILSLVLCQVFFGSLTLPPIFSKQNIISQISWNAIPDLLEDGGATTDQGEKLLVPAKSPKANPASMEQASMKQEEPNCKKWRLVACAMVHNEAAYLIEWIEFHRLQGVEHFVLYSYFSKDLLEYIPMLYELADIYKMVDVVPARFFAQDPKRTLDAADFAQNRQWSMVDCNARYGKDAHWLLLMDAGHFVHSQQFGKISDFIENQTEIRKIDPTADELSFSAVKIPTVRFGTSGVRDKFQTWLTPNADTGSADLNFEPYNYSADLYPLVIESNPNRAPHRDLDANFTDLPVCDLHADIGLMQSCSDSSIVVMVKGGRCPPGPDMDECLRPTRNLIWPKLSVLRADNHNWRAVNHALNAKYWDSPYDETFKELDTTWFSNISDMSKFKYIEPIRNAIAKLKPRIFLDVNRTCRADALKNGQQVMCPESHPYPFGNQGINWLKNCCKHDMDASQNPLKIDSNSCFEDAAIECPDPPGVQKWLHRSCCIFTKS